MLPPLANKFGQQCVSLSSRKRGKEEKRKKGKVGKAKKKRIKDEKKRKKIHFVSMLPPPANKFGQQCVSLSSNTQRVSNLYSCKVSRHN